MKKTKVWNNRFTCWLCHKLARWTREMRLTPPHLAITRDGQPYLDRWFIIPRNPLFNIYLHRFVDSDIDDAHHDHPWWSWSFMLSAYGGWEFYNHFHDAYQDTEKVQVRSLHQGDIIFRSAKFAHRIKLESKRPIVTLFITGPRFRKWGFLCPEGWKHWKKYQKDGGCGE